MVAAPGLTLTVRISCRLGLIPGGCPRLTSLPLSLQDLGIMMETSLLRDWNSEEERVANLLDCCSRWMLSSFSCLLGTKSGLGHIPKVVACAVASSSAEMDHFQKSSSWYRRHVKMFIRSIFSSLVLCIVFCVRIPAADISKPGPHEIYFCPLHLLVPPPR